MLSADNITELSITDRVILSKYLDNVANNIRDNLKFMDISGYGASYSSGRSSEFTVKEKVNGAQLWGMDYLFELENPLTPSQQQAKSYSMQWAGIRDWIGEKPIIFEGDISADTLAGLITRSIREKGTKAYQRTGTNPTGIVSDAITDNDIQDLINDIGENKVKEITEFLMRDL